MTVPLSPLTIINETLGEGWSTAPLYVRAAVLAKEIGALYEGCSGALSDAPASWGAYSSTRFGKRGSPNVRFVPKATEFLRRREMTRRARSGRCLLRDLLIKSSTDVCMHSPHVSSRPRASSDLFVRVCLARLHCRVRG